MYDIMFTESLARERKESDLTGIALGPLNGWRSVGE
jgi:hypothetical protein